MITFGTRCGVVLSFSNEQDLDKVIRDLTGLRESKESDAAKYPASYLTYEPKVTESEAAEVLAGANRAVIAIDKVVG